MLAYFQKEAKIMHVTIFVALSLFETLFEIFLWLLLVVFGLALAVLIFKGSKWHHIFLQASAIFDFLGTSYFRKF